VPHELLAAGIPCPHGHDMVAGGGKAVRHRVIALEGAVRSVDSPAALPLYTSSASGERARIVRHRYPLVRFDD
jgi:hypothetical protein